MRTKRVGTQTFTLLDDNEVTCEHEYTPVTEFVSVNPNGEYVVGYGHAPVCMEQTVGSRCVKCGYATRKEC